MTNNFLPVGSGLSRTETIKRKRARCTKFRVTGKIVTGARIELLTLIPHRWKDFKIQPEE